MPGTSDRRTRGEVKRAEKRKAEKQRKEGEAKRFAPTKVIGRNDILVDRNLGKVKVEVPEQVVVKEEQEDVVVIVKEEVDLNLAEDTSRGGEQEVGTENILQAPVLEMTAHESASPPVFQGKQEIDSDSDVVTNQEEVGSMEQDGNKEFGTGDCSNKKCSKEIADLRKENLLLKQQLEENRLRMKTLEAQNQKLLERNKGSFVGENSPIVIAGKVLPVLCARGYLVLESLLECRLVCKNWKQEVDTFLERPTSDPLESESQLETRKRPLGLSSYLPLHEKVKLEKKYTFDNLRTLRRFLETMETFGSNPFLGRTAVFDDGRLRLETNFVIEMKDLAEYWEMVSTFLKKLGKNLWYITITRINEVTGLELYKLLEKLLPHLQNVKCLTISGELKVQGSGLSEYMTNNPLPALPNLHFLDFDFPSVLIQDAILKICPSLTSLKLAPEDLMAKNLKALSDTGSPSYNLRDLEKLDFDFCQPWTGVGCLETCLKKFYKHKLNELISFVNRFPKLRNLRLRGTISLGKQKPAGFNLLQNRSVEVLQLFIEARIEKNGILKYLQREQGFYIKIISRFPKLRILTIEHDDLDALGEYPKHLRDLDVWTKFECLEAITLKHARSQRGRVYKRATQKQQHK